jgi:hypothetical protein
MKLKEFQGPNRPYREPKRRKERPAGEYRITLDVSPTEAACYGLQPFFSARLRAHGIYSAPDARSHQSRDVESLSGLPHLGIGHIARLSQRLIDCSENHVFQQLSVIRIEGLRIDLNGGDGAVAFGRDFDGPAAAGSFHRPVGEVGLNLGHLLLHLRSLLHEFSNIGHDVNSFIFNLPRVWES